MGTDALVGTCAPHPHCCVFGFAVPLFPGDISQTKQDLPTTNKDAAILTAWHLKASWEGHYIKPSVTVQIPSEVQDEVT